MLIIEDPVKKLVNKKVRENLEKGQQKYILLVSVGENNVK
jgi:hypothetical protein